jgi:hypothetical protein
METPALTNKHAFVIWTEIYGFYALLILEVQMVWIGLIWLRIWTSGGLL